MGAKPSWPGDPAVKVEPKPMPSHADGLADNYRKRAADARARAEAAAYDDFKRQWNDIAANYEVLAALVEKHRKR
jgi:hypothetical protein